MIELNLPWPPSINHYKEIGRTITTKEGKTYQQRYNSKNTTAFYYEVWVLVKQLDAIKLKDLPLLGIISLELDLYPPDRRKRDIDNGCKVLLDSLTKAGLIKDDSQISRLLIERKDIFEGGKVVVRLWE